MAFPPATGRVLASCWQDAAAATAVEMLWVADSWTIEDLAEDL